MFELLSLLFFGLPFLVLSVVQSDVLTGALTGFSYSMSSPTVKATPVQAKEPGALSSAVRSICWGREADALTAHFPAVILTILTRPMQASFVNNKRSILHFYRISETLLQLLNCFFPFWASYLLIIVHTGFNSFLPGYRLIWLLFFCREGGVNSFFHRLPCLMLF